MANPSIRIPDEDLEKLDRILTVQAMLGERENDRRSPLFQEWVQQYIEDNQEKLDQWEAFVEGNPKSGAETVRVPN